MPAQFSGKKTDENTPSPRQRHVVWMTIAVDDNCSCDLTCRPYWTLVDTPSAGFVGIYRTRRKTVWFLNEGL